MDLRFEDKDKKDPYAWWRGNRIYGLHVIIVTINGLKSLTVFEDFVVQGQWKGLVNWSLRILEDKDFPRVVQHCYKLQWLWE